MKKFSFAILSFIALFAISCAEDTIGSKEKVQFVLDIQRSDEDESSGRSASASEIPLGSILKISISTNVGESIMTLAEFPLLHINGSVITDPLELAPGTYKLTDFLIVSADGEVLFATPRRGSALEKYVINPLDVSLTVKSGAVNTLKMDVINVTQSSPEDFGYTAFNINVVHPLDIAVFAATPSGPVLTAAKLTIERGRPIVQTNNLLAKVNKIGLGFDPAETYTLRITKPGFLAYERDVSYNDLMTELNGGTLNVTLEPGMTLITSYFENTGFLDFEIGGAGFDFTIDWGDGTVQRNISEFEHQYAAGKRYTIKIKGNMDKVTGFGGAYGDTAFDDFDLSMLTNLRSIDFVLSRTPKIVDLSKCTRLNKLSLSQCNGTEQVMVPESPELEIVHVGGLKLSTAEIGKIIDRVYRNAISNEIMYGQLDLRFTTIPDEPGDNSMAGPPTAAAINQLRILRDVYFWEITPIQF